MDPASTTVQNPQDGLLFPPGAFVVKSDLRACHPLITATRLALDGKTPDYRDHLLHCHGSHALGLRVSPACTNRMLRIMDAVLKGAETLGWRPELTNWWNSGIRIGSTLVTFRVFERVTIRATPNAPGHYPKRSFTYLPSGCLHLEIDYGRAFKDGVRTTLEGKLRDFATALYEHAKATELYQRRLEEQARLARIKEQEMQDQRERDEARRLEEERRTQEEAERVDQLMTALDHWRTSRRLKPFLVLCERHLLDAGIDPKGSSEHAHWLSWAKQYARNLDPFTAGFPLSRTTQAAPYAP